MAIKTSIRRQTGYSLVEVLIATVILSIGLLGLASLQTASLKDNSAALQRSQATIMAYDILDCMRANHKQATTGAYDIGYTQTSNSQGIAGNDIDTWKQELQQLPKGEGQIQTVGNNVQITIRWLNTHSKHAASYAYQTVTLDTQL